MHKLAELRASRAELVKGLAALQEKGLADDATTEDADALAKALDEVDAIDVKIKAAERVEAATKATADPADNPAGNDERQAAAAVPRGTKKEVATAKLGMFVMGAIKAHDDHLGKGPNGVSKGMEALGFGQVASEFAVAQKTMTTVVQADGGVLVPPDWNMDMIDVLYEQSTFVQGGPRRVPMPRGNYHQPKGVGGTTASYRPEAADIVVSQPTMSEIDMSAKLLSVIVPASNQLLRYSQGAAMEFIRQDASMAMSLKMDEMAYLGNGVAPDPLGIFRRSGVTTVALAGGAAPSIVQLDTFSRLSTAKLVRFPALRRGAKWVMSPRTFQYLHDMRTNQDEHVFPELHGDAPRWKGFPVLVAGTIPENLGVGTNETWIGLVSFDHILLGEALGLSIKVSDEATIMPNGPTGDPVSMFSTDSTAVRFTAEHDFAARYDEAVSVASGVTIGA